VRGMNLVAAALAALGLLTGEAAARGTLTTLYVFGSHSGDGCQPELSFMDGGLLYGTTGPGRPIIRVGRLSATCLRAVGRRFVLF
jgi:hypothetical protein